MRPYHRLLWEPRSPTSRFIAALLAPAEWAYATAVTMRAWAYEAGILRSTIPNLPTLCVGNLTVGGTGKTPLAAWFAASLAARGWRPAIVMRGYGADEPAVHRVLNPSIPVYVSPDRVRGVRAAAAAGRDIAVLDDAFQHRRIRAHESLAIVAAEDWVAHRRLLPRGPWRERPDGIKRATLVAVSRKSASRARATEVAEEVQNLAPAVPLARVHLALSRLARYDGAKNGLEPGLPLAGFHAAVAVAGVARPEAFWTQLDAAAVTADERLAFPDHHSYSRDEVATLNRAAANGPVVATLKDAVKLAPLLAPAAQLYVPVQEPIWEAGAEEVERMIDRLDDSVREGNEMS